MDTDRPWTALFATFIADMESITVDLDDNSIRRYTAFFNVYRHQKTIETDLSEKIYLGTDHKVCRFCGKHSPIVKFRTDAHVIPQSIGNRYLLSYFECDTCNHFFGNKYENSLTNFLSHLRPFAGIENKNRRTKSKRVKHKESKTGFEIFSSDLGIGLNIRPDNKEVISIDHEKRQISLNITFQPYTPLFVYKMFLKIGLSMIDESEIRDFEKSFFFLQDNIQNYKLKNYAYCQVLVTAVPGGLLWPNPFAVLYTKKENSRDSPHPQKVLMFYFSNRIFQIYLAFDKNDEFLIGKTYSVMRFPTITDKTYNEHFGQNEEFRYDLSSDNIVKDMKEKMSFEFVDGDFFNPS